MEPIRKRGRPEAKIQKAIIEYLKIRDWCVMPTHGNMYQQGFPDLYAVHHNNGTRWIEVKNPVAYSFTPAQRKFFPLISVAGGCHFPAVGMASDPSNRCVPESGYGSGSSERKYADLLDTWAGFAGSPIPAHRTDHFIHALCFHRSRF